MTRWKVLIFLSVLAAPHLPAQAGADSAFAVTRADDPVPGACDSDCSLREAVIAANADPDSSVILLPDLGGQILTLTRSGDDEDDGAKGDLDISSPVAILPTDLFTNTSSSSLRTIEQQADDRVMHVLAGGTLVMHKISIHGGNIAGSGGGVLVNPSGELNFNGGTIMDNEATFGAGILNFGEAALANVFVSRNHATILGGGLGNFGFATVDKSTVSSNVSSGNGGGIWSSVHLEISNSTISSNSAFTNGGGVFSTGTGTFLVGFTTITQNEADEDDDGTGDGGGIFSTTDVTEVGGSILVNNLDGNGANASQDSDCEGSITSLGHNVLEAVSGCSAFANGVNGDAVTSTHFVSTTLKFNGGPTPTHLITVLGPSINRVPVAEQFGNTSCNVVDSDQRGASRLVGEACDAGAYEITFCGPRQVNVIGTDGDDFLIGTNGLDGILGLAGDDVILGLDGSDVICGGKGNDRLFGGEGDDQLLGQAGKDKCDGAEGTDTFRRCEKKKQ